MLNFIVTLERACFSKGSEALLLHLNTRLYYADKTLPLLRFGIVICYIRLRALILPIVCTLLHYNLLSIYKELP